MSNKNIVFIIEGEEEEEQEYFNCCVCGVCKFHEEINFTDEKTYCFDCAPEHCIECDAIVTDVDDKIIGFNECGSKMCAKCFIFIGTGKKMSDKDIANIYKKVSK